MTALKLFRPDLLASLDLRTCGFELNREISAKVLARGNRILEVPIQHYPRDRMKGKKISANWFTALRTFWRYRNG